MKKRLPNSLQSDIQLTLPQLLDELRSSYIDALEINKQRISADCHPFLEESMQSILMTTDRLEPIGFSFNRTTFDKDYSVKDKDQDWLQQGSLMLTINNDNFNIENKVVYQIVADGHGDYGGIISKKSVRVFLECLKLNLETLVSNVQAQSLRDFVETSQQTAMAIKELHLSIFNCIRSSIYQTHQNLSLDSYSQSSGCTFNGFIVVGDRLFGFNLGDSSTLVKLNDKHIAFYLNSPDSAEPLNETGEKVFTPSSPVSKTTQQYQASYTFANKALDKFCVEDKDFNFLGLTNAKDGPQPLAGMGDLNCLSLVRDPRLFLARVTSSCTIYTGSDGVFNTQADDVLNVARDMLTFGTFRNTVYQYFKLSKQLSRKLQNNNLNREETASFCLTLNDQSYDFCVFSNYTFKIKHKKFEGFVFEVDQSLVFQQVYECIVDQLSSEDHKKFIPSYGMMHHLSNLTNSSMYKQSRDFLTMFNYRSCKQLAEHSKREFLKIFSKEDDAAVGSVTFGHSCFPCE